MLAETFEGTEFSEEADAAKWLPGPATMLAWKWTEKLLTGVTVDEARNLLWSAFDSQLSA